MPKSSPIQTAFNAGEFSPLMYGQVGFEGYKQALAVCLNAIPYVQGPWTRRSGTYHCDEVKTSTLATRVVGFKFSTTQAYILEFGNLYIRFKRNNGPVTLTGQVISGISQANPGVLTYVGADTYANGDQVDVNGVVGMTEVNGRRFIVANVNAGANTFELTDVLGVNVNTTAFTAYSSAGTVSEVYEIATTYATTDLFQLKFTQSADTLYITHPLYPPKKLTRTAHTAWTLTTITFTDGPYMPENTTTTTMTPSAFAPGAGVTITASAVTGINNDTGFQTTDVGRLIRLQQGAVWGYCLITARASTTSITVTVINTLTSNAAKLVWRLGLWSDTTGFPACCTFHDNRLFFGGSTASPQRIDGSMTSDYENMTPSLPADGTVAANNAISTGMISDDVQVIRWMKSDEKALEVGTVAGEWIVRPSTQAEALSPTNINAKQSTGHGSANVQAIRAGKTVLFLQASGRKIRELAYVYQVDGFLSPDMTTFSEHITKTGITEMAYQQEPQSIIWCVRNDGILLGFTYNRDQKVLAWHRHILGGFSNAGKTAAPLVESVAVIPNIDGTLDEVWLVVKRYINGRTVRFVEYMTKTWQTTIDAQEDAVFVDSCLTYDGAATLTLSGLSHVAGETLKVLADGATQPDVVVTSGGKTTLTRAASVVQVGYGYNSDGQMLRLEAGAADGTAQGKTQRTHRVAFRLLDSLGLSVGKDFSSLTRLPFRTSGMATGVAVPLFTGDKDDFTWEGDYTTENYICWRFDEPLPGTVIAVMPQLHTQDR